VPLGHGVTGVILHEIYDGVPSSTLYFIFPVSVEGRLRHARIALFGDVDSPTWVSAEPPSGAPSSALSNRVGLVLATPWTVCPAPPRSGPEWTAG